MSFPYAEIELNILQRWKINKTFEKQQERTRNNKMFSIKNSVFNTQVIKRHSLFISSPTLTDPLSQLGFLIMGILFHLF